jgi:predicted transcriptional regulator
VSISPYYTPETDEQQSRVQHALSQTELAKRMKSSQSRIAKIEAAEPNVSIELMMRALLTSVHAFIWILCLQIGGNLALIIACC